MNQLGPTIKRLRTERGLSLEKLANAAGLTKAHVWEMERGNSANPSVSTLAGLAAALSVTAYTLLEAALTERAA